MSSISSLNVNPTIGEQSDDSNQRRTTTHLRRYFHPYTPTTPSVRPSCNGFLQQGNRREIVPERSVCRELRRGNLLENSLDPDSTNRPIPTTLNSIRYKTMKRLLKIALTPWALVSLAAGKAEAQSTIIPTTYTARSRAGMTGRGACMS